MANVINNKHNCMEIQTTIQKEDCIYGLVDKSTQVSTLTQYNVVKLVTIVPQH